MKFEGQKAIVLTGFSELIRNASAALSSVSVERPEGVVSPEIILSVALDNDQRQFSGTVETRLPDDSYISSAAMRAASRLAHAVPRLDVQLRKHKAGCAAFEWKLDVPSR